MITRFESTFVLLLLAISANAQTNNWFVRPGGSGTQSGRDWKNAWDSGGINWASLSPGGTVWLAGGNYTNSIFPGHGGSPANPIYIKRVQATDSAPTTTAGWNSAFDSQVVLSPPAGSDGIGFYVSHGGDNTYWDGRVSSGIKILMPYMSGGSASHLAAVDIGGNFGGGPFPPNVNIVFTNFEFSGPYYAAVNNANGYTYYATGVYLQSCTNITIAACSIHGFLDGLLGWNSQFAVFDHCSIFDIKEVSVNGGPSIGHANIIEPAYPSFGYFTWKYCRFWNWDNEGIQPAFDSNGPLTIYGCVFENSGGWGRVIEPRFSGTNYSGGGSLPQGPVYFYNNTCVNCNGGHALGVNNPGVWSSGDNPNGINGWNPSSLIRNNIYWNCTSMPSSSLGDYDYSSSTLGQVHGISGVGVQPFVNLAGTNFHTVSTIASNYPRNKGLAVANTGGNTFNVDPDGNVRGADGAWDIGAYEYNGGASTNPTIYVSPGTLSFGPVLTNTVATNTFTVQNVGGGTLAGTATVAAPFSIVGGGTYSLGAGQSQTVLVSFSPGLSTNASVQVVTFTGGGGATATVNGSGMLLSLLPGLSFPTYARLITAPMVYSGAYIYETVDVSTLGCAGVATGGTAPHWFMSANAGQYSASASVNAANLGSKSSRISIDSL